MKITGPYPPDSDLGTGTGNGGGNGGSSPVDQMLSFVVNASGDTGQVLPAGSFVKWLLLKGEEYQKPMIGIPGDIQLLMQEQERLANVPATMAPCVWLPDQKEIVANGIEGPTRIVIIYSIISLDV